MFVWSAGLKIVSFSEKKSLLLLKKKRIKTVILGSACKRDWECL